MHVKKGLISDISENYSMKGHNIICENKTETR